MIPWVSILTPVYNGVEFLEECALSVCLQNCKYEEVEFTWEWWIGINGHGDGGDVLQRAYEIKRKCEKHIGECKIHVVNLPEVCGKAEALNALVPRTVGAWIAILDCDDTWERDKLLVQRMTVDLYPDLDVIGTFCKYFGDYVSNGPSLPKGVIPKVEFILANPIVNSSAILRRELAGWDDRFIGLDDYDLWLRLISKKFYNIPHYLVNHRLHRASAFNSKEQDVKGLLLHHGLKLH